MQSPESKLTGVKQIAAELGISLGTVDRGLYNRFGASAKTRARVLALAESLQYKPNVAVRTLKLNRHLKVGSTSLTEIASFFDRSGQPSAPPPQQQRTKSTSRSSFMNT
jgi:DNA-binding LacI/PurR family transcriptional regulator